jgi:hypothetical protein
MVRKIQAVHLHRFMTRGRTTPALCGCEDADGRPAGDFVVKLLGGVERGTIGMASELVASLLAAYFDIATPEPALVSIDDALAELIALNQPSKSRKIRKSIGINFGSRLLRGASAWPTDKGIPPGVMWNAAVNIFAFDALIQNPDRRFDNQNLLALGDQIFVFDHELAFSFINLIGKPRSPWRLDRDDYLGNHVFFRVLKGHEVDLAVFTKLLSALRDSALPAILAQVPIEWNNSSVGKIDEHLRALAGKSAEFAEEIRRRLA